LPPPADDDPFSRAPSEDDDLVDAPAPDPSVFSAKPKPQPVPQPKRVAVYETSSFRQTVIPILLTTGTLAIALAVLKYAVVNRDPDSPFYDLAAWVPIFLIVLGLVLLVTAVLNMLHVKNAQAAATASAGS